MASHAVSRAREARLPWGLILMEGIALLLLGVLLMVKPGKTSVIVVQYLGLYWLVAGIFRIVGIFIDSQLWGLKLIIGLMGVIASILVVQHPLWSTALVGNTLIVWLGLGGLFFGAASLFQAVSGAGWARGLLGAVSLAFGAILLTDVWVATLSLPWILGLLAFVGGMVTIAAAFVEVFSPQ